MYGYVCFSDVYTLFNLEPVIVIRRRVRRAARLPGSARRVKDGSLAAARPHALAETVVVVVVVVVAAARCACAPLTSALV